MLVTAALLLLPMITCAPSPPPNPNDSTTEELKHITDNLYCLRQCFGMNTVNVEPNAGEKRCMRLVDSRSLWDDGASEITIEGPRCDVYSTLIVSTPKLIVNLVMPLIRINHTMPSDGAYSQCVRKCLDIDTVAPVECKEGQREFGLITSGKEERYDWFAFYGYGCQTIHTIMTTYEWPNSVLIADEDVGVILYLVKGEIRAVQVSRGNVEEEEETTTESTNEDEEDGESSTESTDNYDDDEEEEEETTSTDSSYEDEEEGESATESTDDYDEEYDDEEDESTEDLENVQKIAKWLPCPLACINRKDEHVFTPLAMKYRASDDDGNWWYNRYTFQDQSMIATLIDHGADTRIRFGVETDGNVFNHTGIDKKMATCLSACMGEEETKHIQACSESALIPTWTIVDGSGSDRDGYGRLTLAIPLPHGGCHSLVTFALSTYNSNKIRIIYARDEEEIFSIENDRAISRIVHTTNSSLLNVDSD